MTQIFIIIGVISTLGSLIGIAYKIYSTQQTSMREEYEFAKAFLTENNLHPFALQKGYQAIAGSKDIDLKVIKYILELKDSPKALRTFVAAKRYLDFDKINKRIICKEKYNLQKMRVANITGAVFFFGLAFIQLFLMPIVEINANILEKIVLILSPCLYAFFFCRRFNMADNAKQLVEKQTKFDNPPTTEPASAVNIRQIS
ncbi:hypothetical protein [uncultured Shewanella sp.]|uniref:hypothetical protein n=1 Tax=uncultured Shewanella sp. TaxID=173975 RepID=UPI002626DCFF|nr:hypothetical protein [uncultured Shewanella sp.]